MKAQRWAVAAVGVAVGLVGCSTVGETADPHDEHEEAAAPTEEARQLRVEAASMAFEPADLELVAGEEVAVVLAATDLAHDFVVDEANFHLAADAGETAEGALHIAEPGTYTAYCSVPGHREAGMEATVTATP